MAVFLTRDRLDKFLQFAELHCIALLLATTPRGRHQMRLARAIFLRIISELSPNGRLWRL